MFWYSDLTAGTDIDAKGLDHDGTGIKLVVTGLPVNFTHQQLTGIFRSLGTVVAAHVVLPAIGEAKGFGYVYMKTESEADRAVRLLHGLALFGGALGVEPANRGVGAAHR
jgi:RNA recognition motif-containing protein